jgi:MFS family permease
MIRTVSHASQSLGPCVQAYRSHSIHNEVALKQNTDALDPPSQEYLGLRKDVATPEKEGEESRQASIERLGRQRPQVFNSVWAEIAFVFSISMSQITTEFSVSGFTVILPTIIQELDIPQTSSVWPATAFSLAIAATLLFFGRLGDMYGGYPLYVAGMTWLALWSIPAGFSVNPLMLNFCRALQGLGAAAYLSNGVLLMGAIYRPGPRKNLVFSIYGASAVAGWFIGIFFAGVVGQYSRWGWYFWIASFLAAITAVSSFFSIPSDSAARRKNGIKMDWPGSALIVSGLTLTVYAITDSSHSPQGWRTPHILTLLVIGCLLLGAAVYVEGWRAQLPLLPFDVFAVKSMKPLTLALLLNFGILGIYLLYVTQYMQMFMGASPLKVVAYYTPMMLGGLILSTAGGFVLHLVPGKALLVFSGAGWIVALLLFALAPLGASYWAFTLPRYEKFTAFPAQVLTNLVVRYVPQSALTSPSTSQLFLSRQTCQVKDRDWPVVSSTASSI